MKLLQHVTTKGVPINNIVFVKPSVTIWSDTCECDIGGYIDNGLAWRWRIPSAWHGELTLNLLEFLELAVTIYITTLQLGEGSHILSFTDSSSSLGWIHKVFFDLVNVESHNDVTRWLRWTLVSNKTSLCSQHIKGKENIIVDYLSRYFHMSYQTLKNRFN